MRSTSPGHMAPSSAAWRRPPTKWSSRAGLRGDANAAHQSGTEKRDSWRLTYPIFYLYRHALELYLKAVFRPPLPRHDLRLLIDEFDELLRQQLRIELPAHLKNDPLIFALVDPNWQGFRYSHTNAEKRQLLPGEYLVPLLGLQRFVEEVSSFMEDALRRLRR